MSMTFVWVNLLFSKLLVFRLVVFRSPDPKAFASADAVSNDSQENIRIYVVQELIKTEEDFLHSLDVIVDDIMKPLSEREVGFG